MPTAKSYENCKILAGPFERDKKMYVTIEKVLKSGEKKITDVRWYTENQRTAMDQKTKLNKNDFLSGFMARKAFGFEDAGYITIFFGDINKLVEWRKTLPRLTIWHNTFFGYFMPSTNKIDTFIPEGIYTKIITWEEVRDKSDLTGIKMMPNDWVEKYVRSIQNEALV